MSLGRGWFVIVTVTLMIALALVVSAWFEVQTQHIQFDLACQSSRNQIEQLQALRSISRTLGLPPTFAIPELPPECIDV